jgi:hypothetical protein
MTKRKGNSDKKLVDLMIQMSGRAGEATSVSQPTIGTRETGTGRNSDRENSGWRFPRNASIMRVPRQYCDIEHKHRRHERNKQQNCSYAPLTLYFVASSRFSDPNHTLGRGTNCIDLLFVLNPPVRCKFDVSVCQAVSPSRCIGIREC